MCQSDDAPQAKDTKRHNFENLVKYLVPKSIADNFDDARREWFLDGMEINEGTIKCPCGQIIKELCFIKNKHTQERVFVGNVCVKNFIGLDTGTAFAGLKRIKADPTANANIDLIEHAYDYGYIFDKEYAFLLQTCRKRKLSDKQLAWKEKINKRILNQTVVSNPQLREAPPAAEIHDFSLLATIERIVFESVERDYCVVSIRTKQNRKLTAIFHQEVPRPSSAIWYELRCKKAYHRTYGEQLMVNAFRVV